jgi:hypothetical protein
MVEGIFQGLISGVGQLKQPFGDFDRNDKCTKIANQHEIQGRNHVLILWDTSSSSPLESTASVDEFSLVEGIVCRHRVSTSISY